VVVLLEEVLGGGGTRKGYRFASMIDIRAHLENEVLHFPGFFKEDNSEMKETVFEECSLDE